MFRHCAAAALIALGALSAQAQAQQGELCAACDLSGNLLKEVHGSSFCVSGFASCHHRQHEVFAVLPSGEEDTEKVKGNQSVNQIERHLMPENERVHRFIADFAHLLDQRA